MGRYQVTAPVPGFKGESCGQQFADGITVVNSEVELERRALSYFKKAGYVVNEIDEAGHLLDADGNRVDLPEGEAGVVDPSVVAEDGNENPQVTDGEHVFDPAVDTLPLPAVEPPPLPALSANKPEWIAAAEARGWTYDQADTLTKPELQEALTKGERPPAAAGDDQDTEDPA